MLFCLKAKFAAKNTRLLRFGHLRQTARQFEAKTFVYLAYALGQRERLITKVFSSLSGTGWSMRNLVDYTVIARPTRLGGTVQIARAIGHNATDRFSAGWHAVKRMQQTQFPDNRMMRRQVG